MNVYGYTDNEEGIMDIKGTMESFEEFVRGNIEIISLTEDLRLVCKKDNPSDNKGMEIKAVWIDNDEVVDVIYSNCFVCRYAENNFSGAGKSAHDAVCQSGREKKEGLWKTAKERVHSCI